MSLVIDATVGSATANSFVTLVEAQAYMDARLNGSTWTAASTDSQNRALVEATREISNKTFQGSRATATQSLSWPRWYVLNPDLPFTGIVYYASTEIPQRVKDATCELAFQFIKAGATDLAAQDTLQNVIEKTVGPLTTRYSDPLNRAKGIGRFPRVLDYIRPLLESSGSSTRILRG